MAYIHYKQGDPKWAKIPYPNSSKKYTIKSSGCGPSSIAILVSNINPSITPVEVADWLSRNGYATKGTAWKGIREGLKHFGYTEVIQYSTKACYKKKETEAELNWRKAMQNGMIGILNMGNATGHKPMWTDGGHYITVTKAMLKDSKEYYYVQDPGGRKNNGWFEWKDFSGYVRNFWTCKPKITLEIDGQWGPMTTKWLQEIMGTPVDGIISNQPKTCQKYVPAGSEQTFQWKKISTKGSLVIKALQKKVKVKVDGKFGPQTIKGLQKMLGIQQTGICDLVTVKALQTWLNQEKERI